MALVGHRAIRPAAPGNVPVSVGKQLGGILEGLELQGIAAGVKEKHCRLLPDLALEADMGLDDEADPCCGQLVSQLLPFGHRQHHAEMAYRHVVTIHGAGVAVSGLVRAQMGDDLMTVEIEIDPLRRGTAFGAAQQTAVKGARLGQVVHGKGEMKRGLRHGGILKGRFQNMHFKAIAAAGV